MELNARNVLIIYNDNQVGNFFYSKYDKWNQCVNHKILFIVYLHIIIPHFKSRIFIVLRDALSNIKRAHKQEKYKRNTNQSALLLVVARTMEIYVPRA